MKLKTRTVEIVGITSEPERVCMAQHAWNLTVRAKACCAVGAETRRGYSGSRSRMMN
jgi:hypothetical protein